MDFCYISRLVRSAPNWPSRSCSSALLLSIYRTKMWISITFLDWCAVPPTGHLGPAAPLCCSQSTNKNRDFYYISRLVRSAPNWPSRSCSSALLLSIYKQKWEFQLQFSRLVRCAPNWPSRSCSSALLLSIYRTKNPLKKNRNT